MRQRLLLVVILALAGAGFWQIIREPAQPSAKSGPVLSLAWTGDRNGAVSLIAEFSWCPINRIGELFAVSGDTGLLVRFHESDSLFIGSHPVLPEISAGPPPWASMQVSMILDTTAARYSSDRGSIELTGSSSQRVSGTFAFVGRKPGGSDTLSFHGSFTDLPVVTRAAGCSN